MEFECAIKNKEKLGWGFHFVLRNFIDEKLTKDEVDFLCRKLSFIYQSDLYVDNPFMPLIITEEGSTPNIQDLTSSDIDIMKETVDNDLSDDFLKGKFCDIIGYVDNSDVYKKKAADSFIQHAKDMIKLDKNSYYVVNPIKRAFYLYNSLKCAKLIEKNVIDIVALCKNKKCEFSIYVALCDYFEKYTKKDLKILIPDLENFVAKEKCSEPLLDIINSIRKYYLSNHDAEKERVWTLKYIEVCKELNTIYSPQGFRFIQKAIDILDAKKYEEEINELYFIRKESEINYYNSLNMKEIDLHGKEVNSINKLSLNIDDIFRKSTNGLEQLLILLENFKPFPLHFLEEQLQKKEDYILSNFFNNISFGNDKTIVYDESESNEEKKREFKISEIYNYICQITNHIILNSFEYNLKLDDSLKEILKEIISKNLFVPQERIDIVLEYLLMGLNKKIRSGLYGLITQFENGCRDYLEKQKHLFPLIRKGGKDDPINLNDMFVKKEGKDNKFRDALVEFLGEDLTHEIEYLACRKSSGNIRNKYAHKGHEKEGEFYPEEINLFFLILEVYCLGYDG